MEPAQTQSDLHVWLATSVPWLLAALVLAGCAGTLGIWVLVARLQVLERLDRQLGTLEEIRQGLARMAAERGDLDLRRIEHVLLELRDGARRLEDALLRRVESPRSLEAPEPVPGRAPAGLAERVTNRLLALGYERVRLVTPLDELEALAAASDGGSGEVVVEARRDGVLSKGRVLLRRGALTEVEIQPAYKVFP